MTPTLNRVCEGLADVLTWLVRHEVAEDEVISVGYCVRPEVCLWRQCATRLWPGREFEFQRGLVRFDDEGIEVVVIEREGTR